MQIKSTEPKFEPVSVILNTSEEVSKFYAIMNTRHITNALQIDTQADNIRANLRIRYADACGSPASNWHGAIINGVKNA
jgi:hypothetical protein